MKNALLIVGVIVLIGAAAVGGYFYGSSQASSQPELAGFDLSQMGKGEFARGKSDSSELSPEQLKQMKQRFAGQGVTGNELDGVKMFAGGTVGEIESIEDGVVTIRTEDAQVTVKTTDTTLIEKLMSVTVEDLEVGEQVVVSGSQNDDGSTTARSIRVITRMEK